MRAEIKRIHSPDVKDLRSFIPEEKDSFCVLLQLMMGPKGQMGEESFDLQVCTPKWLLSRYRNDDVMFGRHLLIVFEYNYNLIIDALQKYCDTCVGETWNEIAVQLSRVAKWEFEDYQSY